MFPILYGSQTGNGIHLANLLNSEYEGMSFVLPIDNFDISRINDFEFAVFIVSTHGDGQCPFNMSKFWHIVTADLPKIFKFKYAVLSLGNSRYPKYNWCGKMLYNRLKQLGAEPLCRVLANSQDNNGMYDGYNEFKRQLHDIIHHGCSLSYKPKVLDNIGWKSYEVKGKKYKAKIVSNKVVTREGYDKQVLEIVFEIPEYTNFKPGCCIGILPVQRFDELREMNLMEEEIEWLENNINLYSQPHQNVFEELSKLSNDELMRNKLIEISKDYELYHSYVLVAKRNIFEISKDFQIADIGFEFLRKLNKNYMRYYSCSLIDGRYHILVSLVEYKTYLKGVRKGICSEYLKNIISEIEVEMTRSKLLMEGDKLLFFVTGSGITLPRSVKQYYKDKEIKVFYGFRGYKDDLLCKEEFDESEIYYAASVDDKKYVMDVFRENPVENIDEWSVFVSGNTRINKEITKLLKETYNKEIYFQSETW